MHAEIFFLTNKIARLNFNMTQSRYAVSGSSKKKPDNDMPKGRITFGKVGKADPIYAESRGNFFRKPTGSDSPHIKTDLVSHPCLVNT